MDDKKSKKGGLVGAAYVAAMSLLVGSLVLTSCSRKSTQTGDNSDDNSDGYYGMESIDKQELAREKAYDDFSEEKISVLA